jgi:hypothetical protein
MEVIVAAAVLFFIWKRKAAKTDFGGSTPHRRPPNRTPATQGAGTQNRPSVYLDKTDPFNRMAHFGNR